jgi:ribosomal protein L7/L12
LPLPGALVGEIKLADLDREIAEIKTRLEKIESQLGLLYRSLGITTKEAPHRKVSPELLELVKKGDKIAAIKAFREETGASLKDAKEFIESLVLYQKRSIFKDEAEKQA